MKLKDFDVKFDSTQRRSLARTVALASLIVLCHGGGNLRSQTVESFEGPANSWSFADKDCRVQVEIHRRTGRHARSGRRCEHIRIQAESGTHVYAAHPIQSAMVITELRPSVWIRSDRVGLQFMARVVLPRSKDPRSGRMLTTLIRGSSYENAGSWQRLHIDDPQALLDQRVPVLRAQFGSQVDVREAYVDLLVLNIYGGLGTTNAWIDDLAVENHVAGPGGTPSAQGQARSQANASAGAPRIAGASRDAKDRVQFRGSELSVDGQLFFPRAIEYRGEPLSWLARLGFNAVKLADRPTPTQMQEAQELGLWLIPPAMEQRGAPIDEQQVLAWDLGRGLGPRDLGAVQTLAQQVRRGSDVVRPLLCSPDAGLHAYGRYADILLHERLPLGTSLPLTTFQTWLAQRSRLARPGTPFWASVQTEPNSQIVQQLSVYDPSVTSALFVEPQQPRILALLSVAAGARGILFQSRTPLDNSSAQGRIRALTLERVNHELSLIEPWIAGGAQLTYVDSSSSQVMAAALVTDRSRLIVPIRLAPGAQYVSGTSDNGPVTLTIPAPESSRAYELTATALKPLRHTQVAGGTQIVLENVTPASLVVLTQDPLVVHGVTRKAAASAERQMRVRRDLAAAVLASVDETERQLRKLGQTEPRVDAFLQQARASFRQCDRFLAAKDRATADHYGKNCLVSLSGLRRLRWEQAVSGLGNAVSSPFCAQYASLPWHWQLMRQVQTTAAGTNLLPAGDFESLDQLLKTGWRHFQHDQPGIRTDVSLSSDDPRAGRFALRLRAQRQALGVSADALETTPVWVNSAPIQVEAGQWVRIHGWVRVHQPVSESLDGFMVFDSSGGPLLAQRISKTNGWQEVTLYRAVTTPTHYTVTFALTGLGDVSIDSFSVEPVGSARWTGLSARGSSVNERN